MNTKVNQAVLQRYRCPEQFVEASLKAAPSDNRIRSGCDFLRNGTSHWTSDSILKLMDAVQFNGAELMLPFDPTEVIDHLRLEEYWTSSGHASGSFLKNLYYHIRPLLPVYFRRILQRFYFHGWEKITFPRWPLDLTVEDIHEKLLLLFMQAAKVDAI